MSHNSQLAMTIFVKKSCNLAHFSENEKHGIFIFFEIVLSFLK
jgi:hypothetical protein